MIKLQGNILSAVSVPIVALFFSMVVSGQTYDVTISDSNAQTLTGWGVFPDQCQLPYFALSQLAPAFDATFNELKPTIIRLRLWSACGSDNQGNIFVGTWTDRGLEHVYDVWNEAHNRGVSDWYVSMWEAPLTMMSANGALLQSYEDAYCTFLINCLNYLINTRGMPVAKGICVNNEGFLTNAQNMRVSKLLRVKLDASTYPHMSSIPVVGNEASNLANFAGWTGSYFNDTTYWKIIQITTCHSYYGPQDPPTMADTYLNWYNRYCAGKPKWMTENCSNTNSQPTQLLRAITMCQQLAHDINYCGFTMWFWWAVFDPWLAANNSFGNINCSITDVLLDYGDVPGMPLNTPLRRSKTFYALAKLWNTARVGSVAHKVTSTDPSFKSRGGNFNDGCAFNYNGTSVVMLINNTSAAKTYNVKGLTGTSAGVYQTTSTQDMALVSSPSVSSGTIAGLTLPASSISIIITGPQTSISSTPHIVPVNCVRIIGNSIELPGNQQYFIKIFDIKGSIISHRSIFGPSTWRMTEHYSGMHIIKATNAAGAVQSIENIVDR